MLAAKSLVLGAKRFNSRVSFVLRPRVLGSLAIALSFMAAVVGSGEGDLVAQSVASASRIHIVITHRLLLVAA